MNKFKNIIIIILFDFSLTFIIAIITNIILSLILYLFGRKMNTAGFIASAVLVTIIQGVIIHRIVKKQQ